MYYIGAEGQPRARGSGENAARVGAYRDALCVSVDDGYAVTGCADAEWVFITRVPTSFDPRPLISFDSKWRV